MRETKEITDWTIAGSKDGLLTPPPPFSLICRSNPKEYSSSYMHLSTPALFAPYVRLELLHWDPLYTDPGGSRAQGGEGAASASAPLTPREGVHTGFDKQGWYEALFDYGAGGGAQMMADDDPDAELVPQLVRKLVLPVALNMLER